MWRSGEVKLGGRLFTDRIFGVLGETRSFGGNAGAPNFGLIAGAASEDSEIRPTFLSQTPYKALAFDFRNMSRPVLQLAETLESASETSERKAEAMLTDLRQFGAGVQYYSVAVEALLVDGIDILDAKPTVAILDTGTTGLVLPKSLFYSFDTVRRLNAQQGIKRAGNVELRLAAMPGSPGGASFRLRRGRIAELDAALDIVTPLAEDAGSVFLRAEMGEENLQGKQRTQRPVVIFVGLGFFAGLRLLVDSL